MLLNHFTQFMRLTIPIRFEDFTERNQVEYKKFIKELPEFSNNPILLSLLDEKHYLKEIKFNFIIGRDELLKLYVKYPDAQQMYAHNFLMVDFTLKFPMDGMTYSESYYADLYLKRLLLLINLSYVLPVSFLKCLETEQEGMHHLLNFIDWGYQHMEEIKWPQINALD